MLTGFLWNEMSQKVPISKKFNSFIFHPILMQFFAKGSLNELVTLINKENYLLYF